MLIDDHRYIAERSRQIAIQEGRMLCPTCQSRGWHEYCDEEGGVYFTECNTCHNPHRLKPPAYMPS